MQGHIELRKVYAYQVSVMCSVLAIRAAVGMRKKSEMLKWQPNDKVLFFSLSQKWGRFDLFELLNIFLKQKWNLKDQ